MKPNAAELVDTVTLDIVAQTLRHELGPMRDRLAALEQRSNEPLVLEPGAKGDRGDPGERGAAGEAGARGDKGDPGERGERGERGDPGQDGGDGADGQDGIDGRDGLGVDVDEWVPGKVYRVGVFVTAYMGQYFRALRDTASEPYGNPEDWERIGRAGFHYAGSFEAGREYVAGDLLTKDFGTFLFDGEALRVFAGRGAKGEPGQRGEAGAAGRDGKPGRDGLSIEHIETRGTNLVVLLRAGEETKLVECELAPMFESLLEEITRELVPIRRAIAAMEGVQL